MRNIFWGALTVLVCVALVAVGANFKPSIATNFEQMRIMDGQEIDNIAEVDDFQHLKVATSVKLSGTAFSGPAKDPVFWTETNTGTGSVTQVNGMLTLQTGSTANSTAKYQSSRKSKFIPAQVNVFRTVGQFSNTGSANNVRRFGAYSTTNYNFTVTAANATIGAVYTNNGQNFTVLATIVGATTLTTYGSGTPTASGTLTKVSGTGDATITFSAIALQDAPSDGVFFQLNGTTMQIGSAKGGVSTLVSQASWNVPGSFTLDTNIHSFDISMSYIDCSFFIDGIYVHEIEGLGQANPVANTFDVRNTFQNINSGGGTADVTFKAYLGLIYRQGELRSQPTKVHISTATTTICKQGAGFLHRIMVNNPTNNSITVYDGVNNTGDVIAVINPGSSATPFNCEYGLPFSEGLTVVTAGSPDLTVVEE